MALQTRISEEDDIIILEFDGRIDSFTIEELNSGFDRVMKTGKKNILLIMKDLEYINSRGIGALLSFLKWVKKVGGMVKIAEVPLNIMQVLNLLGLDGLTLIYESSSDAIESFRAGQAKIEKPEGLRPSVHKDFAGQPARSLGNRMTYLLMGIGFCGLLILGAVVFFDTGRKEFNGGDLNPVLIRLGSLEKRLVRLEGQGKKVPQFVEKVEVITGKIVARMDHLAKEVVDYKRIAESVKQRVETTTIERKLSTNRPVSYIYHKVRNGESLYRISRRYGVPVAKLCRLNKLDMKKHIYPGQTLIVGLSEGD